MTFLKPEWQDKKYAEQQNADIYYSPLPQSRSELP